MPREPEGRPVGSNNISRNASFSWVPTGIRSLVPRSPIGIVNLVAGILVSGFLIGSATYHAKSASILYDATASAQEKVLGGGDDDVALSALEQLRTSNPQNAVYSYLIAAHYVRDHAWQPAAAALSRGNAAAKLTLAESASGTGGYPALPVLRELVRRCSEEAMHRDDETGEMLLRESGVMATRLAREATPCDLSVLQNAGVAWQSVEQARITVWERDERFADAEQARTRLANRKKWWKEVNTQIARVDAKNPSMRSAAAERLREQLPQ